MAEAAAAADSRPAIGVRLDVVNDIVRPAGIGCIHAADSRQVIQSKEELILLDRAAGGSSELVASERIAGRREEVTGVEIAVSQEFESVPVKAVLPDFVTALTAAAAWKPYSAGSALGSTLNSYSAPGKGRGRLRLL